jgi:hypothetical protein
MSRLPREARDGLMRAWLEILRERHPGITWVPITDGSLDDDDENAVSSLASHVEATPALVD